MKLLVTEEDLGRVIETMDDLAYQLNINSWENGNEIKGFSKEIILRLIRTAGFLSSALGNTIGNIVSDMEESKPEKTSIYARIDRIESRLSRGGSDGANNENQ